MWVFVHISTNRNKALLCIDNVFTSDSVLMVILCLYYTVGHTATHAVVVARLITKGVDHGVHTFIVQLRSFKDHTPLPGVWVHVGVNVLGDGMDIVDSIRLQVLRWVTLDQSLDTLEWTMASLDWIMSVSPEIRC